MSNAKANRLDRNVEAPAPSQAEVLEALERVYEGTGDADSDWQDYDAVHRFIEQAGTVPEEIDIENVVSPVSDPDTAYCCGWNDCRDAMLEAAPKQEDG